MSECTPLLSADHGEEQRLARKTSGCLLHKENCFLSDGLSKDNLQHRKVQRKLLIACLLCVVFMIVEVIGGYMAHSIAILSDAAHMLSDVAGFAVSLFAAWAVTRKSHSSYSFGYHRIEILGALVSVLTIWFVTGALVFEACMRILYPEPVNGKLMFLVACAGIAFNLMIAAVLGEHHVHGVGGHCQDHDHEGHSHGHGHGHGHGHSHGHRQHGKEGKGGRSHAHSSDGNGSCGAAREAAGVAGTSCCIITMPLPASTAAGAAAVVMPEAAGADAAIAGTDTARGFPPQPATAIPPVSAVIREGDHEVRVDVEKALALAAAATAAAVRAPQAGQLTAVAETDERSGGGSGGGSGPSGSGDTEESDHHHHKHHNKHAHVHVHEHKHKHKRCGGKPGCGGQVPVEAGAATVAEERPGKVHASGDDDDEGGDSDHGHKHEGCGGGHGHGHGHKHTHARKEAADATLGDGGGGDDGAAAAAAAAAGGGGGGDHDHSHCSSDEEEEEAGHTHGDKHKHRRGHGHGHAHGHGRGTDGHGHGDGGHGHGHGGHGPVQGGHGHGHGHGHGENINLRSAVLHVVGDLLQSIGVAAAGALIWWKQDDPRWQIADPICTFIFAGLVMMTTRGIIADITHTLMERTPQHVNLAAVMQAMTLMEGILDVHDLHVWNLSMGLPILTAHVHIAESADADAVLRGLEVYVREQLRIQHSTIQICNYQGAAVAVSRSGGAGGLGSESGAGPSGMAQV